MINFRNTRFIKSAISAEDSLFDMNHIVTIGRSNVGKSTLINCLADHKNLAFVSKRPGQTKLLNYFNVDNKFYLVDAPGYGYRKTGKKDGFDQMMESYFQNNKKLKLVLWLLDSRRELSKEDLEFVEFFSQIDVKVLVCFTKVDKLNQSEKEIDSLKWNYNNQIYIYYRSKNDEILNQYGILDLDNEDWYISGYDQKSYFTYDLKYYHTTVETIIDQMKIDGVITSYNEKETYDVVSATRINPEYYELKKSNKIKIKHSFPSIYLGYDNISIDNYLYPNGIFYSEEEIMEAYNSREEAEGYTDYYLSRIEYFDFSSYVYIISSPFDTTDTEGFSYSMDITDVYLQDETLYCLYQKITRPNKVYSTTLSSEKTQIVIQIHKAYLRKNKDYKIVELY